MQEEEIRKAIYPILYVTEGKLYTDQVKDEFPRYINLSAIELGKAKSRNEKLYRQHVGNVVSHQDPKIESYKYGFELDKRRRPAKFILQKGIEKRENFTDDDLLVVKMERTLSYSYKRKFGINSIPDIPDDLLQKTEEYELNRVRSISEDMDDRVYNLKRDYPEIADNCLFHMISANEKGYPISIFIEASEKPDPLHISQLSNEAQAFIYSRCPSGSYAENKNYIYFVSRHHGFQIEVVNTMEVIR